MRIDLVKYIQNWLPVGLRSLSVVELYRVLLSRLPKAHNDFEEFAELAKYKANANASVISLEHHIAREFDVIATITALDGTPTDFLVSIDGYVDEHELSAFIDRWKLAGMSYVFRQGEVKYSARFINHVCEDIAEVWTAQFANHVCEDDRKVYISWHVLRAIPIETGVVQYQMEVRASQVVQSNIVVNGETVFSNGQDYDPRDWQVTIASGTNKVAMNININSQYSIISSSQITSINPLSDEYYNYIIKN